MNAQDQWEAIYREFAPEVPATAPEQRAVRTYSPVDKINKALHRKFGPEKFLVTGSVGTGKTTELYRVAEAQTAEHFVVLFDVDEHFRSTVKDPYAINNLQSWELVFLVGLAVYRAAEANLGHAWSKEASTQFEEAVHALQGPSTGDTAKVNVPRLAASLILLAGGAITTGGAASTAALTFKVIEKAAGATTGWNLPLSRRRQALKNDQDGMIRALLHAVNRLIQEVQGQYRSVLVLLDGLDRIEEDRCVEDLFIRSRLLSELSCSVVAIAPVAVRRGRMDIVRGFQAEDLVNVPVVDRDAPHWPAYGRGVDFFEELTRLRLKKLKLSSALISTEQIQRLAWCSGGRARDFVKLIRSVATGCYDDELSAATDKVVEAAIDEARRLKEMGMNKAQIELLRAVLDDQMLPDGQLATDLLNQQRLVPYPNDSTWYYPHPLLTLNMVKPSAG